VRDDEKLRRRSKKKTGSPGRGLVRRRRRASSLAANGAATEELLAAARARMERCGVLDGAEKKVQGLELGFYRGEGRGKRQPRQRARTGH
jgi:hypothetical protein